VTASSTKPQEFSAEVREHYEELPYPYCNPETESKNFYGLDGMSLDAFNHVGWEGKRDLRKGARILLAGCGTGDMMVNLAEQLVDSDTQIVAIDLSTASLNIAKARVKKRGLTNVTFHHMSILDLPKAGLGEFDIIESSGVLHHLPDPNAGLAALASMLKDDGIMGIMVYAQYGRMAIYMIQDMLRKMIPEGASRPEKIAIAREFLTLVPHTHWMTFNGGMYINDLSWPDGSGIYDLFLHSTDRAYTVPQLYEWVEGSGLQLTDMFGPYSNNSLYNPDNYTNSDALRHIFASKPPRERFAIAELMHGAINKHYFYAAKMLKKQAQLSDDMVITFGPMQWLFDKFVPSFLKELSKVPVGAQVEGMPRAISDSPLFRMTKTPYSEALLRMLDGKRSIGSMVAALMKEDGASIQTIARDLNIFYHELANAGLVFLRHESIPPYRTGPEMMQRVRQHVGNI